MKKSILLITIIVAMLALAIASTIAEGTTDANWCFEGGPWGDGRCNSEDPYLNNFNWVAGWCHAQIELGNLNMSFEDCIGEEHTVEESTSSERQANPDTYDVGCYEGFKLGDPGVLDNDDGKNLEVISYTNISPSSDIYSFKLKANGSMLIEFNDPGTFTFSYTINGGSSAKVTIINECEKEPEPPSD